ncbi:MAG: hypothetical protein FWD48_01540 [Oscillospiraceae bacterium]|nr:hypothetical protein [Oscillospiraceae bacterium]
MTNRTNKEKIYTDLFDIAPPGSDEAFVRKVNQKANGRPRTAAFKPLYALTALILVIGIAGAGFALNGWFIPTAPLGSGYEVEVEPEAIDTDPEPDPDSVIITSVSDAPRVITIGTWYDMYYTSQHDNVYDNPWVYDIEAAEMQLANMRAIEERYNIRLEFVNLGWGGIQESIQNLMECDVYFVDFSFGAPVVFKNLAASLESLGLENTDVFGANQVMRSLNLSQPETYLFAPSALQSVPVYPLAFNLDMILEKGLENPQDLWDRGEWTWDVWREYLIALTVPEEDIYGWGGYWTNMLENLLFSNGTAIATEPETIMMSPEVLETFEFFYTIYNTDRTGRPLNETSWQKNNDSYVQGKAAFFVGADWILSEHGAAELPFEIGVVPWPIGPSGNQATNSHSTAANINWFFIPANTENPRLVYDVMFDWHNWYDYDRTLAEDLEWSRGCYMNERNFDYAYMMSQNLGFDLWYTGGGGIHLIESLLNGEMTAAEFVSEAEPLIQQALDIYMFNSY